MKEKIIRFIDSQYNTIFTIPDGGNIELRFSNGEKVIRKCRYIDDYHTKVDHNVYHICEFAECMEQNGTKYAPAISEKELNESFVLHNDKCDYIDSNLNTIKESLKASAAEKSKTPKYKDLER